MLTFLILLILFFLIIFLFSSKTLSPIPYFPSQPVDIPKIVKALNLKNNQIVYDLGAGDGIVIFEAAEQALKQNLNTQFVAVEINLVLLFILYLRRLFHQNRKNIRIVYGDMFKMDFPKLPTTNYPLPTFYLYISPWFLEKTITNIKKQIKKFSVVSYMYEIKSLKNHGKIIQGKNRIFVYFSSIINL